MLTCLSDDKAIISDEQLFYFFKVYLILPWHDSPFPEYPSLQVQLWEPLVLVQFAFTSQSWLPLLHSSISRSISDV